jgi:hypothetical protein
MEENELLYAIQTLNEHEQYRTLLVHMETMLGEQIQATVTPAVGVDGHIDRDRHFMNTGMTQGMMRFIELMKQTKPLDE